MRTKRRVLKKRTTRDLKAIIAHARASNDRMRSALMDEKRKADFAHAVQVLPIRSGHLMEVLIDAGLDGRYMSLDDPMIETVRPCRIRVAALPQFNVVINAAAFRDIRGNGRERVTYNALREMADRFGREIFLELVRQAKAHNLLSDEGNP